MTQWLWHDPWWLAVLLAIPMVAWLRGRRRAPVLVVPFAAAWHRPGTTTGTPWPLTLAYLGFVLLAVALARPQRAEMRQESNQRGYDIVLAIDLSGSMLTEDFERDRHRINRLQAVKPVLEAFINDRPDDRIGLVVFSGRAYTMAPLTFDHDWLRRQTGRLSIGLLEDGTAIGDGLGVALSRLERAGQSEGFRREGAFVILLTDGSNNAGALDPRKAAQIAADRGVIVYTIGAGREGVAPIPVLDQAGNVVSYRYTRSDLDEPLLQDIATMTSGRYFRAQNSDTVDTAFNAINQAEKIEFEARSYMLTEELFTRFVFAGLVCLLLAILGTMWHTRQEALA